MYNTAESWLRGGDNWNSTVFMFTGVVFIDIDQVAVEAPDQVAPNEVAANNDGVCNILLVNISLTPNLQSSISG